MVPDEGYLTDARGVTHECKQTVFIMTSNLGTPQLHEAMLARQAALEADGMDPDQAALDSEAVEEVVEPVIQSRLRPELLGTQYLQLIQCNEQNRHRRRA